MDEEVKRRRKEREQQAAEQRLAEERRCKMQQDHKHLLANLFNQSPLGTQSLGPSQGPLLKPKQAPQAPLQRTQGSGLPPLHRMSSLRQTPQNMAMLSLQRNPGQSQQRSLNSWSSGSAPSPASSGPLPSMVTLASNLSQFYPQSFLMKSLPLGRHHHALHQGAPSNSLSSKNPLDEILDLTSSPSPSPDAADDGLSLDSVTRHSTVSSYADDFPLDHLISPGAAGAPPLQAPPPPPPLQNHSLLPNNHQDILDFLETLSPHIPAQKSSPSSSTSSSSASSTGGLLPVAPPLIPSSSSNSSNSSNSSSLFSSSSSSSLFSGSSSRPHAHFSSLYLPQTSDSLALPNGHCSASSSGVSSVSAVSGSGGGSGTLDVREALNSMLQAGPDRKSVIQYRLQD